MNAQRRPAFVLALLAAGALLGVAGFIALGVWQIERRAWKLDLIDRVAQRVHALPTAVPAPAEWPRIGARTHEYLHVRTRGTFLHQAEVQVAASTSLGSGYWILTPLQSGDGSRVLVNRGFVPPELRDPSTRAAGQTPGPVEVEGLLRLTEPGGGFLRANQPATGRWYSRDVQAIAASQSLAAVAPFFIDADATPVAGGWPRGGLTVVSFRNQHLSYALTWFALAFMLAGGAVYVLRDELRRRRARASSPGAHLAGIA